MSKNQSDSKLQGINRLLVEATLEVTDLVEKMQHRIVHPPLLPSTPLQHFITDTAGLVYKNIRWSTKFIGKGADKALGAFAPVLNKIKTTKDREAFRAVLNGLLGDHLEKTNNSLKIKMSIKSEGKTIELDAESIKNNLPAVNSKILLMIHGSCMNDSNWTRKEHNHGIALAAAFNKTPLFLSYNSGLHISTNGKRLSNLLNELVVAWPVPVEEITILAHSMGGLIARSALYYGKEQKQGWTKKLKTLFFLGTPHHGASLEKAGNYVEALLKAIPYANPFARLAKIRGAGVTDLRYGNLLDEDWQDIDQHAINGDQRIHVPLSKKIEFFTIAGVAAKEQATKAKKVFGDNLVIVNSALGKHRKASKSLAFKEENTAIVYETNHSDLLASKEVYSQLKQWMEN